MTKSRPYWIYALIVLAVLAAGVFFLNGHLQESALHALPYGFKKFSLSDPLPRCLVSCDHIPRRSMPLFRAKAVLDELISGFPPRSPSHRSTSSGRSTA